LDPALGLPWPAELEPVLSDKDAAAPSLEQAIEARLLPDYAECQEWYSRLRGNSGEQTTMGNRV
jgi:dTDP-4-dehydrorhamnose 3,5-epimerase